MLHHPVKLLLGYGDSGPDFDTKFISNFYLLFLYLDVLNRQYFVPGRRPGRRESLKRLRFQQPWEIYHQSRTPLAKEVAFNNSRLLK